MTDLATLVTRLQADNSQYMKALDQATNALKKHAADSDSIFAQMKDGLGELAAGIAAAYSVDAIVEFSAAAIESQASVLKMSESTGIAVEQMQSLNLLFASAGLSSDQTGVAMKKLGQSISEAVGDPMSKASTAFELLGINAEQLKDMSLDQVIAKISQRFQGMEDGPNKVALAIALMGRSGQTMIPVLNRGADALNDINKAAALAGAGLSEAAAKDAEEFEIKLNTLKAVGIAGLGNAISAELLPTLNNLTDAWNDGSSKAEAYQTIAQGVGLVLKVLASIALELGYEIQRTGVGVGAAAAYIAQVAQGHFSQAKQIWESGNADLLAIDTKYAKLQDALWADSGKTSGAAHAKAASDALGEAMQGAGGKTATPNLEAGQKTKEADKALLDFSAHIKEQTAAYGLGEAASVSFQLQTGKLAEDLKIASDVGQKAAQQAIASAALLAQKKDTATADKAIEALVKQGDLMSAGAKQAFDYSISTGELGKSLDRLTQSGHDLRPALEAAFNRNLVIENQAEVEKLNADLLVMQGHLAAAAAINDAASQKKARDNFSAAGNTQGIGLLDQQAAANQAEAKYNELTQQGSDIQLQYSTRIAQLNLARSQGAITDLAYQQQVETANQTQIAGLNQVLAGEQALVAQNPDLVKLSNSTKEFANQITNLKTQENALAEQVRGNLESAFADNFQKLISGAESFRDALKGFLKDILASFESLISKNLAQQLFGAQGPAGGAAGGLAGLLSGSGGTGTGSALASLMSIFGGSSGGGSSTNSQAAAALTSQVGSDSGLAGFAMNFAGMFADGGVIPAGQWGIAGENGPEPVYGGSSGMSVHPAGSLGGKTTVNNTFTLPPQGGTISRQTQSQAATEVARRLTQATRRAR